MLLKNWNSFLGLLFLTDGNSEADAFASASASSQARTPICPPGASSDFASGAESGWMATLARRLSSNYFGRETHVHYFSNAYPALL